MQFNGQLLKKTVIIWKYGKFHNALKYGAWKYGKWKHGKFHSSLIHGKWKNRKFIIWKISYANPQMSINLSQTNPQISINLFQTNPQIYLNNSSQTNSIFTVYNSTIHNSNWIMTFRNSTDLLYIILYKYQRSNYYIIVKYDEML